MEPIRALIIFVFLTISCSLAAKNANKRKQNDERWSKTKYQFVIIGGGTAGMVLASRLAEVPNWRILVLEDGDTPAMLNRIPAVTPMLQRTVSNWQYFTEPQSNLFQGLYRNQMHWPSGHSIGGSSALHYMIYTRGNKIDYDLMEKQGLDGWNYERVLPYFLKSEQANFRFLENEYHNFNGVLALQHPYIGEGTASFLKAAKELGYNATDYNGDEQLGFSSIQATMLKGARQYIHEAYFKMGTDNYTNLEIVRKAFVTKLVLNDKGTKVKAVKFIKGGKQFRVGATKEVLLCSGTFNTPKILLLSGMGPPDHLKQLGIKVVKELPGVGENLHDHVTYPALNFMTTSNRTHYDILKDYIYNLPFWFLSGLGIGASLGGFESLGFVKVDGGGTTDQRPDIELLFYDSLMNRGIQHVTNIKDEIYDTLYNGTEEKIHWSIFPVLLHPKSRGTVRLQSKNPLDPPKLNPNYFNHSEDMSRMIAGIQFTLKMILAKEFQQIGTILNPNPMPGCAEKLSRNENEYWECALRMLAMTAYDQAGTCRMGKKDDPMAVVDNKFKVRGVNNLRVVDASVVPNPISGHLYAPVIMMAERAADFIKNSTKL